MTQIQLSRAFACLLRLIADVMSDLVNHGNESSESEVGIDSETTSATGTRDNVVDLRRSASAPVFMHSSTLDVPLLRKLRNISRKNSAGCLPPLRTLMAARPAEKVDRALICAAVGFVLAPVWAWLAEALDGLESRLCARVLWNARHPNLSDLEATTMDSGQFG